MDPELFNLYLQSVNSTSGAGRLEDLLYSPMLGLISGGFNPLTLAGSDAGSSPLMSSYMSDPNPVIQQIIQHIQQGSDPYRVSSFVDDLMANNEDQVTQLGFQPEDLKNLAIAMQKEYSGGGTSGGSGSSRSKKGGMNFAGAGLSNPLDVYDATNTPITGEAAKLLSKAMAGSEKISQLKGETSDRLRKSKEGLGPLFGKKFNSKELVDWLKSSPEGQRLAAESGVDFSKVDPETGEVFGWRTSRDSGKSPWDPRSWIDDAVTNVSRTAEIIAKQNIMGGKPKTIEDKVGYGKPSDPYKLYEYEQAQLDEAALRDQEFKNDKMKEAVMRGVARAYQESGRTPFGDEMKKRLTLLARVNNK